MVVARSETVDLSLFLPDTQIVVFSPHLECSGDIAWLATDPDDITILEDKGARQGAFHLCSGIGGFSLAAQYCHIPNLGAIDYNDNANKTYAANFTPAPVRLDILSLEAVRVVTKSTPSIITAGVPCQPFSRGGDQRGFDDPRSAPLLQTLRILFVSGADYLVLENVSGIKSQMEVQLLLESFCLLCGYSVMQKMCDLICVSPMHRERWIAVLTKNGRTRPHFTEWPSKHTSSWTMAHPIFQANTAAASRQLQLTDQERNVYFDARFGSVARRDLSTYTAFPTLVHAYGNALSACPCGCRTQGLGTSRLLDTGAWGVFVIHKHGDKELAAWAHPKPLAQLMGYPNGFVLPANLRLALAQLGNAISVQQAAWALSAVAAAQKGTSPEHTFAAVRTIVDLDRPEGSLAHCSALPPTAIFDFAVDGKPVCRTEFPEMRQ